MSESMMHAREKSQKLFSVRICTFLGKSFTTYNQNTLKN